MKPGDLVYYLSEGRKRRRREVVIDITLGRYVRVMKVSQEWAMDRKELQLEAEKSIKKATNEK